MPNINFPSNPTASQTYTFGSTTWTFNGVAWVAGGSGGAGQGGSGTGTGNLGGYSPVEGYAGGAGIPSGNFPGGGGGGASIAGTSNATGGVGGDGLASAISVLIFFLVASISFYGLRKSKVMETFG